MYTTLRKEIISQWAVILGRLTPYQLEPVLQLWQSLGDTPFKEPLDAEPLFRGVSFLRVSVCPHSWVLACLPVGFILTVAGGDGVQ